MQDRRQFSRAFKELMPDVQFYWSGQEGVKLTPPMILFDILADDIIGSGEKPTSTAPRDVAGDTDYVGRYGETREVIVRVSFIGKFTDSTYTNSRKFMAIVKSFQGRSAFYRQGLSVANISPMRPVDVSTETTAYTNNYVDITLRYKSIFEFNLEPIEEVEVSHVLTVDDDLGTPEPDYTITGTTTITR